MEETENGEKTFFSECNGVKKQQRQQLCFVFKMILSLFGRKERGVKRAETWKNLQLEGRSPTSVTTAAAAAATALHTNRNGAKKKLWHRLSLLFQVAPWIGCHCWWCCCYLWCYWRIMCLSLSFASKTILFHPVHSSPSISFVLSFVFLFVFFLESRLLLFNLLRKKLVVLSCFMQSHTHLKFSECGRVRANMCVCRSDFRSIRNRKTSTSSLFCCNSANQ